MSDPTRFEWDRDLGYNYTPEAAVEECHARGIGYAAWATECVAAWPWPEPIPADMVPAITARLQRAEAAMRAAGELG